MTATGVATAHRPDEAASRQRTYTDALTRSLDRSAFRCCRRADQARPPVARPTGTCTCGVGAACASRPACRDGACVCDGMSCKSGLAAPASPVCRANSDAACGGGGLTCQTCATGGCTQGACNNCNPGNCANGCCSGSTCYHGRSRRAGSAQPSVTACDPSRADTCASTEPAAAQVAPPARAASAAKGVPAFATRRRVRTAAATAEFATSPGSRRVARKAEPARPATPAVRITARPPALAPAAAVLPASGGQRCVNGLCTCDSTSCPSGCCAGTACGARSLSACGNCGLACVRLRRAIRQLFRDRRLPMRQRDGVRARPALRREHLRVRRDVVPIGVAARKAPASPATRLLRAAPAAARARLARPVQTCGGGRCSGCNATSCPAGCCSAPPATRRRSRRAAAAAPRVSAATPRARTVARQGEPCACGTGPACAAGQRCSAGKCVCNATSCPSGCCDGATCVFAIARALRGSRRRVHLVRYRRRGQLHHGGELRVRRWTRLRQRPALCLRRVRLRRVLLPDWLLRAGACRPRRSPTAGWSAGPARRAPR